MPAIMISTVVVVIEYYPCDAGPSPGPSMSQQWITPTTDQTYFKHWNVIMAWSPRGHFPPHQRAAMCCMWSSLDNVAC